MAFGLYSFENLWRQYRACRRNKRGTLNQMRFEIDAEAQLLDLQRELRAHTYTPGRSICFVTDGPKPREVFAADFRDRIVHHVLVAQQQPLFERRFIHDSYACRDGKGTLAASDRLMQFLCAATANGRRRAWALKLDIASFFASIHKQTLYRIIARQIRNPEVLWLTRTVLFHDPTTNYHFRSHDGSAAPPNSAAYPVVACKSLFGKHNECGLPIGNLTSQFWANVYLDELDQFVKRVLKCRWYVRYVDDLVLLSESCAELAGWCAQIQQFLRQALRLELRADSAEPFVVGCGVTFVGWRTWWNRRLVRRQTVGNLRRRLDGFSRAYVRPVPARRAYRIELRRPHGAVAATEPLLSTLASYSGYLRHGAAMRDWRRAWSEYPWLAALFRREKWEVVQRWPSRRIAHARRFRDQYGQLIRRAAPGQVIFCQVGGFVEFYGPQRLLAEELLGLRRAALRRCGLTFGAGFPVHLTEVYLQRVLRHGRGVMQVGQCRRALHRECVLRLPQRVWLPWCTPSSDLRGDV
jgi:hypothetical protein